MIYMVNWTVNLLASCLGIVSFCMCKLKVGPSDFPEILDIIKKCVQKFIAAKIMYWIGLHLFHNNTCP